MSIDEIIEEECRRAQEFLDTHILESYGVLDDETMYILGRNSEGSIDVYVNNHEGGGDFQGWTSVTPFMLKSGLAMSGMKGEPYWKTTGPKRRKGEVYWSKAKELGIDEKELKGWDENPYVEEIQGGIAVSGIKGKKEHIFWSRAKEFGIEEELNEWEVVNKMRAVGGGIAINGKHKKIPQEEENDKQFWEVMGMVDSAKEVDIEEIERVLGANIGFMHLEEVYWSEAKRLGIDENELKLWFDLTDMQEVAGGLAFRGKRGGVGNEETLVYWSKAKELGIEEDLKGWGYCRPKEAGGGLAISGQKDGVWQVYWSRAKELGVEEKLKKFDEASVGVDDIGGGLVIYQHSIGNKPKPGCPAIFWSKAGELGFENDLNEFGGVSHVFEVKGGLVVYGAKDGKGKAFWSKAKEFGVEEEFRTWEGISDHYTLWESGEGVTFHGKKDGIPIVCWTDGKTKAKKQFPGFDRVSSAKYYQGKWDISLYKGGEEYVYVDNDFILKRKSDYDSNITVFCRGSPVYVESIENKLCLHFNSRVFELKNRTMPEFKRVMRENSPHSFSWPQQIDANNPRTYTPRNQLETILNQIGVEQSEIERLKEELEKGTRISIPNPRKTFNDPFRVRAKRDGKEVFYFVKRYEGSHNTEDFALREINFGMESSRHGIMKEIIPKPACDVPLLHNGQWMIVEEDLAQQIMADSTHDYVGIIAAFHSYAKHVVERGKVPLRKIELTPFEAIYKSLAGCRIINARKLKELEGKYNAARHFLEDPNNQFDVVHNDLKPDNTGGGKILDNESLSPGNPAKDLAIYNAVKSVDGREEEQKVREYCRLRRAVDPGFSLTPRDLHRSCRIVTPYVALKELAGLAERKDFGKEFYMLKAKLGI